MYPHTEKVWLEALNKVYQTGEPVTIEEHAKEINMYVELTVFKPREDLIAMIGTDITGRKQVENDLQFSKQMLRNVLDNIPICVYWKDTNSVYLGCNKNFVKDTLAHSIDEVIGKTDFDLCPNMKDAEVFRADDQTVISTKKEKINSEESFTQNDKTYWRSSSKVPLFNDKNEVFGVLGAYTDITEQKVSEYELIKEKERAEDNEFFLKESQRIGNIGSYKLDMATGVFQLDEILEKMFGVESLPVKNLEAWFALIHPEDQEMLFNYFNNEVIAKKQIFDKEYRILTYDKKVLKWIYSIGNIYMDEAGNVVHMQGTVQDITERKKIEHETLKAKAIAEKNEKRYEGLLNNLSAGIIVHAPDTSILHNNAFACTLLGLTDEQLKQKDASDPYWQFYDSDNNALSFEDFPVNIISRTKKPLINFIAGLYRPSLDNKVWLEINGYPLLNSASEITEIVISLFDITERYLITEERKQMNKRLENQVKERTAQLIQANKDLESFAYSVSHDLRAPIRHINGFVHLLKSSLPSEDDKVNNYIQKITASSNNMSTMIDELLQFSKLGRANITSKKVDLNSCIRDIIAQFKPDYESRIIKWDIKKLPDIHGEPALLKLVFENLISNAIKYTSKKEEAVIEIGQVEKSEPGKVGIYIKDNGAGFDMAYKDKLFGVFQRLHKKEEFEGVGIGLANVKQIIKKHDGEIYAESALNKGATFYITLPTNKQ
ncbi:MAG: PAS domain S-box protein [Bacteroidales bacterium]|nr:PAS domain S-box protein [Bacteroidales bacterium]